MDALTGPQGTPEQRDELAELAGVCDLVPVLGCDHPWRDVDVLYRAPGWEACSKATADVDVAGHCGVKSLDLVLR